MRDRIRFVFVMIAVGLTGCSSNSKSIEDNGGLIHERNEGYGLLYVLMSDESKVDQLLVIKSASPPVAAIVKEISAVAKQAKLQLESYVTPDSRIVLDEPDLPKVEKESRDLESKEDTKKLLFSGGKEFELNLIFTQAQASGYAANLCKALGAREDDPGRKEYLIKLGQRFAGFRDRLMAMLQPKT